MMHILSRRGASLRISGLVAAAIVFILTCFALETEGAVFRIEPSIMVSEEYNDNVFLQRDENKIESFITRLSPSIRLKYTTSFWDWDLNYTYSYYYYTRHRIQNDYSHLLFLRNRTELIQDYLYVEVRDDYSRVSQNVSIDYTQQSPTANQVDQNIFAVNPYLILRPSTNSRTVFGYIFQDVRYLNGSVASQAETINHLEHIAYGDLGINLSSRMTFTAGARYTHDFNHVSNYTQIDVYAGPQYAYAENAYIFARGGKTWFDFEPKADPNQNHPRKDYWFWDGGLNHRISTLTFALGARRYVIQDPVRLVTLDDQYTASISNTWPRAVVTLSGGWNEYRDAMLNQRLSRTQQVQGSALYRFATLTTGTLGAGYQDVNDTTATGGVTKIVLSTLRVDQQLSEKATLSFEYRFANSHSYDIMANNYSNNRFILEFRQIF